MKTRITLLAIAVALLAAPASAQQLFDFLGQANVPTTVGGMLSMSSVVYDPAPGTTPIPLDFGTYQYTLVVDGLQLDSAGTTQVYSGGTISLYEDMGTMADYAMPGTFTDGTAILVGTFTALNRTMFTSTLGSVSGFVDWNGGTRLDDIAPADQVNWAFVSNVSRFPGHVEAGYDEEWDGKVEPANPIVDTETMSFGSVKAMMR